VHQRRNRHVGRDFLPFTESRMAIRIDILLAVLLISIAPMRPRMIPFAAELYRDRVRRAAVNEIDTAVKRYVTPRWGCMHTTEIGATV